MKTYVYLDGVVLKRSWAGEVRNVSLLVAIGVKVVRHGRYVTFQMAEVAVPRDLLRQILRQIDVLRPPALATG